MSRRNGQLIDITQRLREAQSDAAVARATAGAVISGRGDIAAVDVSAFVLDYDTKNAYDNSHVDKNVENGDQEILSASMLHEMTGSIEKKENMARQLNLERECIERMQSHFQAAFENLQEEARVLSEEREDLLSKLNIQVSGREDSGGSQSNAEKERMKGRIDLLEKRIRELKLKASEHSKAIRMKEAAETKCAQLAAEIADDKKRRAALQRKLKEEAEERRSERSVARVHAARMLRDSQKLKYELNKVKDAAAKQGVVLRRKIDAIAKQKAAQEKKEKISAANRPSSSRGGLVQRYDSLKTELSDDGLDKWINDEIESASVLLDFHDRIEEQNKCLTEAFRNKEDLLSGMENSGPSSSDVDAIRSLDNEIDSRTRLLKDLQRSLSDVQKAQLNLLTVGSRAANEGLCSSSSFFADELKFRGFSRSELRVVATNTVHRIIIAKKNLDRLQEQHKKAISSSVKAAMLEEKRRCDEVLANLKMEHSEAIMLLLESTKNTVECTMSRSMLLATDGVIDESFRATVDEMLGQYMEGCSKVGAEVRQNLLEIKGNQDMMRDVVDKVANDIITSSTRVKQSKGNKGFTTAHVDDIESEEELSEGFIDETSILEDSDSDWDPGSPGRQGRLETRGEKVSNSNAGGDAKERYVSRPLQ